MLNIYIVCEYKTAQTYLNKTSTYQNLENKNAK